MRNITCENCINYNDGWCEKILDSPDKFRKRDCQYYKTRTNADRIRSMTAEELAEMLCKYDFDDFCQRKPECDNFDNITDEKCKACAIEWLQKEVEE